MRDLVFVALVIVFFTLAGLYVTACDRLVGRERVGDVPRTDTPARR
jgi:hypothetical protein